MIYRVQHNKENPYFMLNRAGVNDERLSFKAVGILTYLLSKPDNWTILEADLVKRHTDGDSAIRTGLKELRDFGYFEKVSIRDETTKRITGWETHIYETPKEVKSHNVENPPSGNSTLWENAPLISNDYSKSIEGRETVSPSNGHQPVSPFLVNGMTAGELAKQRGQAQKYSPEYKWEIHRPVFEAIVDIMGVQALVDADDARVIGDYQDVAVILVKAGLTADAVLARKEQWLTTWPGKDGGSLSQLKMFLVKKAANAQSGQMVKVRVLVRPNQGDAFHDIISMPEREAREGNYEIAKG